MRTWRPPVAQAEVGPLSNAAREKRADPSLTWLRKGLKTRKISDSFGFYELPRCCRFLAPGCGNRDRAAVEPLGMPRGRVVSNDKLAK